MAGKKILRQAARPARRLFRDDGGDDGGDDGTIFAYKTAKTRKISIKWRLRSDEVMIFSQSQQTITFTTDDCDLFLNLASRIKKSFYDTIGRRNKIIVFYNESELIQRKYLLKMLSHAYHSIARAPAQIAYKPPINGKNDAQNTPQNAANLPAKIKSNLPAPIDLSPQNTAKKDIKLVFQKPNSVQLILEVNVHFKGSRVVFEIGQKVPIFVRYLAQNMREGSFDYFEYKNSLIFTPKTRTDIEFLDSTLGFKHHLTFDVHFIYDREKYEKLKHRIIVQSSQSYATKMGILAEILAEDFETLGCSPEDDYESVRMSFLELSKAYHPDLHKGQKGYGEKFSKIKMAYEAIKPYYLEQRKLIG